MLSLIFLELSHSGYCILQDIRPTQLHPVVFLQFQ